MHELASVLSLKKPYPISTDDILEINKYETCFYNFLFNLGWCFRQSGDNVRVTRVCDGECAHSVVFSACCS